jgi:protein TonB
MAKQTGARGQVKLAATIGKDGRVKGLKVLSGHPMLQNAAMDAVWQWVYRPTLLNGVAVETETEIVINFQGAR